MNRLLRFLEKSVNCCVINLLLIDSFAEGLQPLCKFSHLVTLLLFSLALSLNLFFSSFHDRFYLFSSIFYFLPSVLVAFSFFIPLLRVFLFLYSLIFFFASSFSFSLFFLPLPVSTSQFLFSFLLPCLFLFPSQRSQTTRK